MVITEHDKRRALAEYDEAGFTVFRDVIDRDLIGEASDHVAWLQEQHPDLGGEELGHTLLAHDPFWVRLISDPRLLDIAETFIGPDIALFASHYISKPPFTGKPVFWHQDGVYWPLEPMKVVTLWLSVDESNTDNGCLRVVPGSHKMDFKMHVENLREANVLGSEIAVDVDEKDAYDIVLHPGDVDVHHPNIIHGSDANTSPNRRCGLTIRYIPTSTKILGDEQPFASALHLQGDRGVNVYKEFPTFWPGKDFPFEGREEWMGGERRSPRIVAASVKHSQ